MNPFGAATRNSAWAQYLLQEVPAILEHRFAAGRQFLFASRAHQGAHRMSTLEQSAEQRAPSHTFVQLVGVAHPSPSKTADFPNIDRVSALGAITAAQDAGIQHLIYLSVAQPAPMMKSYIAVRIECEAALRASGMNATIVRPWYVLGPGHRWPYALLPMYWICEHVPATRDGARRLGLVTLAQMTHTLVASVENPCAGIRIIEVPQIRAAKNSFADALI